MELSRSGTPVRDRSGTRFMTWRVGVRTAESCRVADGCPRDGASGNDARVLDLGGADMGDTRASGEPVPGPASPAAGRPLGCGRAAPERLITGGNDSNGASAAVRAVSGTTATDQRGTPNDSNGPLLLSGLACQRQQRANAAVVRTMLSGRALGTTTPGRRCRGNGAPRRAEIVC